jgi:hypothetical protein
MAMTKAFLILIFTITTALPVSAWNASGHMTCGAIAYYYLKEYDTIILSKVLSTLRQHPWYSNKWQATITGLKDEEKDVALFMLASTYPDDARSIPELGGGEKSKWHYVDYPYSPDNIPSEKPKSPNAEEKIVAFIQELPKQVEGPGRAVNLSWLFHLIEDIHQPLHTVSLFDKDHSTGDRGGNDTYIRLDSIHEAIKLHSYWDRLVTGVEMNIPEKAERIMSEQNISDTEERDSLPNQWIKESNAKAVVVVYASGKIRGTKLNPTLVGKEYIHHAQKEAYHDVYMAGIRLAQQLEKIYR